MMMHLIPRRKFLVGLATAIVTPAIVKFSSLMPIKSYWKPWGEIDVDGYMGMELKRTDLELFERVKEFALKNTFKLDGIEYRTFEIDSSYYYADDPQNRCIVRSPIRRCTARFLRAT